MKVFQLFSSKNNQLSYDSRNKIKKGIKKISSKRKRPYYWNFTGLCNDILNWIKSRIIQITQNYFFTRLHIFVFFCLHRYYFLLFRPFLCPTDLFHHFLFIKSCCSFFRREKPFFLSLFEKTVTIIFKTCELSLVLIDFSHYTWYVERKMRWLKKIFGSTRWILSKTNCSSDEFCAFSLTLFFLLKNK